MIKDSYYKIVVIKSLNDIEEKIKAFSEIEDNRYYIKFVSEELSDEEKVRILNVLRRGKKDDDYIINNYIYKIRNANLRLEAVMQNFDFKQLGEFIKNQKLVYILNENFKRLELIYNKMNAAMNSNDDKLKIDIVRNIKQKYLKLDIIISMQDDDKKIQLLRELILKSF